MEVRAKKSLGQHFLTDLSIAQRIADSLTAPVTPGDCTGDTGSSTSSGKDGAGQTDVLEVGPGMGVLTQFLLQRPNF